jgi:CRISPR-associated protein Cmr6
MNLLKQKNKNNMPETFKNIGLFYQKYYFKGINFYDANYKKRYSDTITDRNQTLLCFRERNNSWFFQLMDADSKFPLKNVYPGLATGIGMKHETSIEGELKLGLYFDYTSGMPCIPASSVKGALRSAFPQFVKHTKTKNQIKLAKAYVLTEMLHKIDPDRFLLITKEPKDFYESDFKKIKQLEEEIFEGKNFDPGKKDDKGERKEYLSVYEKDSFHDAFILNADSKGRILVDDAITNHPHPLKNPNPVLFLKVISGVTIQFNFDLKNGTIISSQQKKELFQSILKYYGIGSKTNVGYGQFEE